MTIEHDYDYDVIAAARPDDQGWKDRARCATVPDATSMFFPNLRRNRARPGADLWAAGRRICAGCEVRNECLGWWLTVTPATQDSLPDAGLVAGADPHERARIRRYYRSLRLNGELGA